MERRKFLKTGCQFCLLTAAGLMLPASQVFADRIRPFKTRLNDSHQAEIPVELFAETNLQIVRVKGMYYDIALHKDDEGNYTAFVMRCTHMDNQLTLSPQGFRCSLHGSEYDKKGQVTKGPAENPLTIFPLELNETNILINIPNNEE
jgi:Rieske Fe-S protein